LADYQQKQEHLTVLREEIRKDREIADNLPTYKQNYERLQKELEAALTELPDQKEIPSLLTSITNAGIRSGLEFLTFRPKGEENKGFYAAVPVDIVVEGPYANVGNFFVSVGNLSRIVNLTNVSIGEIKEKNGRFTLKVSCLATTFRFLSASEQINVKK
jgi:type IV pilus assembly protein PilO